MLEEFVASKPADAGVVPWAPPLTNWNAWTSCNIDEGPLASVSMPKTNQLMIELICEPIIDDSYSYSPPPKYGGLSFRTLTVYQRTGKLNLD